MGAAILFDFNGVLIEDERFHWLALRELVAPHGIILSRRDYLARYLAGDDPMAIRAILRDHGVPMASGPLDRLVRRKREIYRRLIGAGLRMERRVANLVRALARRLPLAIVSGAAGSEVKAVLRKARLARQFRAVIAAEDVRRPKPDPEGYRLALRRLRPAGVRGGSECLAIEDSPAGIRAAAAAGLRVVGVSTSVPARALRAAGAIRVVPTLASVSPDEVLRW